MEFDWIEPGVLAASGIPLGAQDLRSLHKHGIRAIVSLTEYPLTTFDSVTLQVWDELDITYFHSPIPDGYPPGSAQARGILQFINQMKALGARRPQCILLSSLQQAFLRDFALANTSDS